MANYNNGYQPGLEVSQPEYYSAPEALGPNDPRDPKYNDSYYAPHALPPTHPGDPKYPYAYGVVPGAGEPPTATTYGQPPATYPGPPPTGELHADSASPARSSKKKWWIIGGIVLILIIIGAVVGGLFGAGVIGSKKSQSADNDNDSNTTGTGASPSSSSAAPSATPSPAARFIRQGSPLTVAGWESPEGDTEIFLFHQDADNNIHYSRYYDGSTPVDTLNDTLWAEPVAVDTFATANTRMAATLIIQGTAFHPQVQIYYSGGESRMLGFNVNLRSNPTSGEDSINNSRLVAQKGSAAGAYWPWFTYQSAAGELMEVRNKLGDAFQSSSTWDVRGLGITTQGGSAVVMVPMSAIFRNMAVEGGFGLIYRNSQGVLALAVPRLDQGEVAEGYARSWPEEDLPTIAVELDAPIAAFSVARPNDSSGRVDTYVLYLVGTDIHMVYTAGGNAWKQVEPTTLRDVDPDTDIACITLGSSISNSNGKTQRIPLPGRNTKCYFQRGGVVQEVVLSGTEWTEGTVVPIP
ncbi:hypothetical protein F5X68DRAFT_201790 [Plectosphaerella plurivora]|uniref:Fucose-specific lectin n=1 Tax=Plectosphaerella plurivora TaxID=936078 RepID=A0A9P8VFA7_9PEZI|nr:hypothetical protein F5X68DRAFT_201790 [Plectosphaerella plurivora]